MFIATLIARLSLARRAGIAAALAVPVLAFAQGATAPSAPASPGSPAPSGAAASTPAAAPGAAPAPAGDPSAAIRAAVEGWLKGRFKVDEVRRAPVPGMFEVRISNNLIYVDERAQHAFVEGQLIELRSGRNLTRERIDELLAIRFDALPLALAIKQVNGTGKRQVAVFEDPNCGYCRQMRRDLVKLENATIYTFVYPILSPDSEEKSRKALCAADKVRAWNDLMLAGRVPGNAGTCDTPIAKIREFGQKHGITSTPTVFFGNGRRVEGAMPLAQFEQLVDQNAAR